MNHGTKFCRLCLKLLLRTILTCSLPFYPYQKDKRALPGYLLTRCSFFPLRYKAPLAFPQMFFLYFYSYTILFDSLSLSLFVFKGLNQTSTLNMIYRAVTWSLELGVGITPCQMWHNDHTSLTRSSGPRSCKLHGDYIVLVLSWKRPYIVHTPTTEYCWTWCVTLLQAGTTSYHQIT
jgi:hypothetical protein